MCLKNFSHPIPAVQGLTEVQVKLNLNLKCSRNLVNYRVGPPVYLFVNNYMVLSLNNLDFGHLTKVDIKYELSAFFSNDHC